jgi:SAM-dependent methyltransferase
MTMTDARWRSYWADKSTPQYAQEHVEHYRDYAAELRLLFPDPTTLDVLEIGCGNGALHRHLGFDRARRYRGVDFSRSMLAAFRTAFPDTDLVCADGASYRSQESFDLLFSSQVAQYWSRRHLVEHVANMVGMLRPGGLLVISGIPWSRMRFAYARGDMTGGRRRTLAMTALAAANEMTRTGLGNWFDFPDIDEVASRHGLWADHRGSLHYPYRFHAVLRRASDDREDHGCSTW